jgi:peptidyl-prolyl cis-trans isomerase A (cyclophilin A)
VQSGFFNGGAFFRVVPDFIAQWGLSSDPFLNEHWDDPIADDPTGVKSNLKGTISFATAGPNTRTTQVRRVRRGKMNRCVF